MKTIIEFEEEIEVCESCYKNGHVEEVYWADNDWDLFQVCDKCGKDSFISTELKTIKVLKQQITRYKLAK